MLEPMAIPIRYLVESNLGILVVTTLDTVGPAIIKDIKGISSSTEVNSTPDSAGADTVLDYYNPGSIHLNLVAHYMAVCFLRNIVMAFGLEDHNC